MKRSLALLLAAALISCSLGAKHAFQDGEKITLWANKGLLADILVKTHS